MLYCIVWISYFNLNLIPFKYVEQWRGIISNCKPLNTYQSDFEQMVLALNSLALTGVKIAVNNVGWRLPGDLCSIERNANWRYFAANTKTTYVFDGMFLWCISDEVKAGRREETVMFPSGSAQISIAVGTQRGKSRDGTSNFAIEKGQQVCS